MARVDPTARVADGARLAADAEIGPYCIVGGNVELRAGVRLHSHVNIQGVTVIGERSEIYPFASLGTPPQSNAYRGGATRLTIGSECRIREGVTMSTGSEDGGGVTAVGSGCFFMANSHVGHDCSVGDHVTFANNAVLGGHVTVADHVFVGGNTAVHQFVRIGEGAMLGGMSGVTRDVIPYGFAFGPKAALVGINVVGLRRRGFARADIHRIRRAYRALFGAAGTFAERLAAVAAQHGGEPAVVKILSFIRDGGTRPLMMAADPAADSGDPP
ncbi:MAG: acyl-ACP--UDP-N-acetylglucosamine O-acyltransferase [Alphaproteobacteria bacterium]|nr:acyl-ACP--UDP-N-acetylglucosamine O-acyltransferase [Alphaproteobacteria bacterium]